VIKELLGTVTEDHLTLLLSEMIRAEAEVRSAFSPRVALEMGLIRASFLNVLKPIGEAIENIESFVAEKEGHPRRTHDFGEKRVAERPEEEKAPIQEPVTEDPLTDEPVHEEAEVAPLTETSSPPASEGMPSGPPEGQFRDLFFQRLEPLNHLLAIKLSEAEIIREDDTLVITFNGGASIHADSVKKNLDLLRRAAEEVLGKKVAIKIDTAKKKIPRKKEVKEKILSEPLVKEAIELFEGRIVDIRPMDNTKNGGKNV
jgi:DNA polymerase-3 subunit gamma/tau